MIKQQEKNTGQVTIIIFVLFCLTNTLLFCQTCDRNDFTCLLLTKNLCGYLFSFVNEIWIKGTKPSANIVRFWWQSSSWPADVHFLVFSKTVWALWCLFVLCALTPSWGSHFYELISIEFSPKGLISKTNSTGD